MGLDFKELVRAKTDLVQLVGESVGLRPQHGGRTFTGLCPFHDDHNPSFQVNPERQSYRCWVCNEGGDCFSFVMKHESLNFREALELLARRASLELPKSSRQENSGGPTRTTLYDVLDWAQQQFHEYLMFAAPAARARNYLSGRGFTDETIARFRLGYCPDVRGWLVARAAGKFTPEQLEAASLLTAWRDGNGFSDAFADRVMFPIRDERSRVVAFGGRILPDAAPRRGADGSVIEEPKYKNSRETPIFAKSRLVFGLDTAREAIKQADLVAVVEGYTDCIKAQQAGLGFVVGTLGTALTELHVTLLRRFTRRVALVYDGDEAGKRAAVRALGRFIAQDVDLRVLTLPESLDPDEYLDAYGTEALQKLIEQAPEAWEYQFEVLKSEYGLQTVDARGQVSEGMLGLMAVAPSLAGTVREGLLLQSLAHRLGVQQQDLRRRLKELRNTAANRATSTPRADGRGSAFGADGKPSATVVSDEMTADRRKGLIDSLQRNARKDDLLECELLAILFAEPNLFERVRYELGPEEFRHPVLSELLLLCFDLAERGLKPEFATVSAELECPQQKRLAVWIDDQATARDVRSRLSDVSLDFLGTVLEGFRWRRTTERLQRAEFEPSERSTQAIVAGARESDAALSEANHTPQLSHNAGVQVSIATGTELALPTGRSPVAVTGQNFSPLDQRLLEAAASELELPTGEAVELGATLAIDTKAEVDDGVARGENATTQPLPVQTTPPTNTNSDAVKQLSDAARARLARSADFHQLRQQRRPL